MTAGAGPGPERRDFGDIVRLALHAAADQIEPCTDGLEGLVPIRARILARAGVPWPQAFAISRVPDEESRMSGPDGASIAANCAGLFVIWKPSGLTPSISPARTGLSIR